MKRTVFMLFVILVFVVMGVFSSDHAMARAIKVGVIAPLSGGSAFYGLQQQLGMNMALDEINGAGGVKGIGPIELVYLDDEGNPTKGVTHALRLIHKDKVDILVGAINSASSLAILQVCEKEAMPMLNVLSSTPHLTDQGAKWIIHTALTDAHQVPALVDMAINKWGMKGKTDIALLHDADDYGKIAADIAEKELRAKGYDPPRRSLNRRDRDFSGQLLAFKQANVKTILIWAVIDDAAAVLKQVESLGLNFRCMGGSATGSQRFADLAGKAGEGFVATLMFAADEPQARVQEFVKKFNEKYPGKMVDWCVSQGYDGLYLIKAAVEQIGPNFTKAQLRDTLRNIKCQGVLGTIAFDKTGSVTVPVLKVIVKDGKFTFYER